MTPGAKSDSSQTQSLSLEFDLQHSPAKVCRALTDPTLLAEWFPEPPPCGHSASLR